MPCLFRDKQISGQTGNGQKKWSGKLSTSRHMETTSWILPSIETVIYPIRQNCYIFTSLHNLTDHEAIPLSLESPVTETKPLIQNIKIWKS